MAKRQNRRTFSVRAETYVRMSRLCKREGWTMSGVVESLIVRLCDQWDEPKVERGEALRELAKLRAESTSKQGEKQEEEHKALPACFTF